MERKHVRALTILLCLSSGCGPASPEAPETSCAGDTCEADLGSALPRFSVDWQSDRPRFDGMFFVADEFGNPIPNATFSGAGRELETGADGHVRLAGLEAIKRVVVRVTAENYVPASMVASYDSAGTRRQTVTMLKLGEAKEVDTDNPVTLRNGDVQWQFSRNPFVRLDGRQITGPVNVRMTAMSATALPRTAIPADNVARAMDGSTTLIREHVGLIFTQVESLEGESVAFAPGSVARLKVKLPPSMRERFNAGTRLGMFSLDREHARWVRESTCEIEPMENSSADVACLGTVTHFSHWLVAEVWPDYGPGAFGCVNIRVDPSGLGGSLNSATTWTANLPLRVCDGDGTCTVDAAFERGWKAHLPSEDHERHPSLCGIARIGADYRFEANLVAGDSDQGHLISKRFIVEENPDPAIMERLLQGAFEPARDCTSVCQQVTIRPGPDDAITGMVDADRDGFFTSQADAPMLALVDGDCDDQDPKTYPGAAESPCDTVDRNCDGLHARAAVRFLPGDASTEGFCTNTPARASVDQPLCPAVWNRHCAATCFEKIPEARGDGYDDDCDGRITDRDGDGFEAFGDGAGASSRDCDDSDPNAHPSQREQPGNGRDEDCDGIRLDADGDGYYAAEHQRTATALGLAEGESLDLMFGDCDDGDPNVNPGIPAASEAGRMAGLFTSDDQRLAHYCEYFEIDGSPSALLLRQARDLNCDGFVTDADGDGLTSPGDLSLGQGANTDCDDFDPRIGAVMAPDGTMACDDADRSKRDNASECEVRNGRRATAISDESCPLLASQVRTECAVSATGDGLCIYPGWEGSDPPRSSPGSLWGPCDGGGRALPDCPEGASCGSPVAYSEELTGYLEATFTEGEPLEFKGMCFRTCTP